MINVLTKSNETIKSQFSRRNSIAEAINLLGHADIQINTIRNILLELTLEEFDIILNSKLDDLNFTGKIVYYLWIFKEDDHIKVFYNHKSFDNQLLLKFVYYGYGQWVMSDSDPDQYFNNVMLYITPEKALDLLLHSPVIQSDPTLTIYLIANLDIDLLETFLIESDRKDHAAEFFIEIFNQLEEKHIKQYFFKNPDLYSYIIFLFKNNERASEKYKKFFQRYKEDIDLIDKVTYIVDKINKNFDLAKEKTLLSQDRNKKRIAAIIEEIRDYSNIREIVSILHSRGIFLDENEKDIVYNILTNDFLKEKILKPKIKT
ncbi:MAG: hypothetical protein H7A23_07150 [Leptospiraceae bacterium]|nr:hypothetical protein [Leptospiraceae bacterium]MCP5494316.1 hypothetical protein [Leptospiraceae bacterium]